MVINTRWKLVGIASLDECQKKTVGYHDIRRFGYYLTKA